MTVRHLSADAIRAALSVRDLTDPDQGPHAIQILVDEIERALARRWGAAIRRVRAHPVVSVEENYDALLVGPRAAARDARYTRYLNETTVLRTMTSVLVPPALRRVAGEPPDDVVLSCPGIVYRRDAIDRRHTGEPHQLDVWRLRTGLDRGDLTELVDVVCRTAMPGREWRAVRAEHPYTTGGLQVDVRVAGDWIEVGECGMAHPRLLARCGVLDGCGLASGWGLDRLLMIRKGIDDIRLLRSADPRVAAQMLDLDAYEPVSAMPAVRRDLSVALSGEPSEEDVGDAVRDALGAEASAIEAVEVLAVTAYDDLPDAARRRLGIAPGQVNALVRVVLRHLERTLTDEEANILRDRIYAALHEGTVHAWASR